MKKILTRFTNLTEGIVILKKDYEPHTINPKKSLELELSGKEKLLYPTTSLKVEKVGETKEVETKEVETKEVETKEETKEVETKEETKEVETKEETKPKPRRGRKPAAEK